MVSVQMDAKHKLCMLPSVQMDGGYKIIQKVKTVSVQMDGERKLRVRPNGHRLKQHNQ